MTGATAREVIRRTVARLEDARCESPGVDAEILLAHVLGLSRAELRTELDREMRETELEELEELVLRREEREPLAYVIGEWGFRRLTLAVDSRVLVPRPETEVVVERCLAHVADIVAPRVLDVGTGSGAIALAIADEHPGARVTAIDRSTDALDVARLNAVRTALDIELVEADLHEGLPSGPWDLVVSNPPYVRREAIGSLQPEITRWEPRDALVGEGATEAIVAAAPAVLAPGGALVLEVAAGEAGRVVALLEAVGLSGIRVTHDLAGRDRVVEGLHGASKR